MREDSGDRGRRGRILLAEDHPLNQRVATAMLDNLGLEVDVVADGSEAVKAAMSTSYRAILMDCQLPILDGYEATREIRRLEGSSRRTPVIAVTASPTSSHRQRCLAAGMDDYLTKPLSVRTLAAVLDRWAPARSDTDIGADAAQGSPAIDVGQASEAKLAGPALDTHILDRLERLGKASGEDLLGELTALFLREADASVASLREALSVNDDSAVNRWAHTLSGASANLGATDLASLCATLANPGAPGGMVDGEAQLARIEAELERVRSALGSRVPMP
jgi:two-component system, sensor histidine kinase and response regulator